MFSIQDLTLTVCILGATSAYLDTTWVHALQLQTVLLLVSIQHATLVSVVVRTCCRGGSCAQPCGLLVVHKDIVDASFAAALVLGKASNFVRNLSFVVCLSIISAVQR